MRISPIQLGAAALAVILMAGCSRDQTGTTSPLVPSNATAAMFKTPKAHAFATAASHEAGATWAVGLPTGLSASQLVGPAGGTLRIPLAGLTVVVPSGAVTSPTTITVSIHAGKVVAYDFAPHGLTFLKPLILTQQLSYITAPWSTVSMLNLGYYADPGLVDDTGAMVSESNAGIIDPWNWSFVAPVWHFSGYMVATGRSDTMPDM